VVDPHQLSISNGVYFANQVDCAPMEKPLLDCLTERHLSLFGSIVQWFARYEALMQAVMAAVVGADFAAVMFLTRGLDFNGKRRALLDLLRHRAIPLDQFDRINRHLVVPHTFSALREDIAHSTWTSTTPSSWIQPNWVLLEPPGVKPLRSDPRALGQNFAELDQDKSAYSLERLDETVQTLAANYETFADYLREIGLMGKISRQP
jgi:hypothetical protein